MTHEEYKKHRQQHIQQHLQLHAKLDELAADYVFHTGKLLGQSTIMELLQWSNEQTRHPSAKDAFTGRTAYDASLQLQAKAKEAMDPLKTPNTNEVYDHIVETGAFHSCEETVHGVFKKCGRFAKFVARLPNGPMYLCEHHSHNFPVEIVKAIIKETGPREKVQFPEDATPMKGQFKGPVVSVWERA